MLDKPAKVQSAIPFDADRLDRLMDEAGIDILCATSKHNVQYLLGGHRAFFFESMDAMGLSRYLPVLVYPKGGRQKTGYFGHRMETYQNENQPFWVSELDTKSSGSLDAMEKAIDYIRRAGCKTAKIAAELSFLPADAAAALRRAFPNSEIEDAVFVLERLRAVKSPAELEQGSSLNRAPSEQKWGEGDILSLDSGGNYHGYIGDLCRMAIQGEPDAELQDLLGEIEDIQRAAMKPIKAGAMGSVIYGAAEPLVKKSKHHNHMHFLAHGMGLVSHEAPRLTASGPVPYDAYDANRPLETGMVVSVETTLQHPQRGFIKLEDTVVVKDKGFDIYGEPGWGWNRGGTKPR